MNYNLIEALTDYQLDYVDNELGGREYDPSNVHTKLFKKIEHSHPNRIVLDLNDRQLTTPKEVVKHLFKNGYEIEDYDKGLASKTFTDKYGNQKKQLISIGKVLERTNGKGIQTNVKNAKNDGYLTVSDLYNNSRGAIGQHYNLVISRDKQDIAGMSTDRNWHSCTEIPDRHKEGGCNSHYIGQHLNNHTLVAYLVKKGDDDIENPIGRVLIKKYYSNKDESHIFRTSGSSYGSLPQEYSLKINNILKKIYPAKKNHSYVPFLPDSLDTQIREDKGIVKNKEKTILHYNEQNNLHDYIDKDGNYQPAVIKINGDVEYYKNGELHRDGDEPAIKKTNGEVEYYKNGMLHRDGDKPAVVKSNGDVYYYKYGMLHREGDKPSVIGSNGNTYYHKYGKLHRDGDEPSKIEFEKGNHSLIEYYKNGLLHREGDKPAIIEYGEDGKEQSFGYLKQGEYHREGGKPARIVNRPKLKMVDYYLNGVSSSPDKNTPHSYRRKVMPLDEIHEYSEYGHPLRGKDEPSTISVTHTRSHTTTTKGFNLDYAMNHNTPVEIKEKNYRDGTRHEMHTYLDSNFKKKYLVKEFDSNGKLLHSGWE